jgi:hypothetical protein
MLPCPLPLEKQLELERSEKRQKISGDEATVGSTSAISRKSLEFRDFKSATTPEEKGTGGEASGAKTSGRLLDFSGL